MRPAGDVRQALFGALRDAGPLSLRDAAQAAQVGLLAAKHTLAYASRSGAVQVVGREKRAHCRKWVRLYELAPEPDPTPRPPVVLALDELGQLIATHWRPD